MALSFPSFDLLSDDSPLITFTDTCELSTLDPFPNSPFDSLSQEWTGPFDDLPYGTQGLCVEDVFREIKQDTLSISAPVLSPLDSQASSPFSGSSESGEGPVSKRAKRLQDRTRQREVAITDINPNMVDDSIKKRITCPVCKGAGRNSERRICGTCYSGLWNDCAKAIRAGFLCQSDTQDSTIEHAVVVIEQALKASPRGCKHSYSCKEAAFEAGLSSQKKCTRCRSIFTLRFVPDLAVKMVRNCRARINQKKGRK